ncbi:ABC transporter ATP-binding protein [Brucella rhizosphaerae]|uniref:sn-glycerol-3-phosphate import ATP-binding protein UgpC n=1 Tax=Brucella rhizosphaerae TaxID=571254 RepID=A0A256F9V4_9HYPH|nr:ABC transporter ATP-binding protein [Brucella rhizosphaerae]OYR11647.1 sn-glycerol-3-phosphate import ATP-binding protein UgpC [Brucella rhizosphaerae]
MSISLKNIHKSFKTHKVLDSVSFDVATGETVVLFGPSGAGKTVLLRLIAGVVDSDEGSIFLNGQDMTGVEPEDRGLGMAFQNFALFPHMDAAENIAAPLTARRLGKDKIKEAVGDLARLLKIDHVTSHKPKELSNGQKQRTALARALAGDPSILLLDDPLRNVDAKLRFEMRLELPRLLRERNATVIYVTQDYKEAMALGDRIAVLDTKGIAQIGTPEDIYCRPATVDIARLFGDPVINLLEITPEKLSTSAIETRLSGGRLVLPQSLEPYVGQTLLLGLRPEAIRFAPSDTPGVIPITIEAETPLNEKTVSLAITERGREIMLSRPAGTPAPDHGPAHVAVDANAILLFDPQTGRRVELEGEQ